MSDSGIVKINSIFKKKLVIVYLSEQITTKMSESRFRQIKAEYSKSSRSKCQKCQIGLNMHELRLVAISEVCNKLLYVVIVL